MCASVCSTESVDGMSGVLQQSCILGGGRCDKTKGDRLFRRRFYPFQNESLQLNGESKKDSSSLPSHSAHQPYYACMYRYIDIKAFPIQCDGRC